MTRQEREAEMRKMMRDAVYADPVMKQAIARHIEKLDLQGQVNKGVMTEDQAFAIFKKETAKLNTALNNAVDKTIQQTPSNVNDLNNMNNPDWVSLQLANNPNAPISQWINGMAMELAVEEQINEEITRTVNVEHENSVAQFMEYDKQAEDEREHEEKTVTTSNEERAESITEATKSIDEEEKEKTEEKAKDAFLKVTGLEPSLTHSEKNEEEKHIASKSALVPKPPTTY